MTKQQKITPSVSRDIPFNKLMLSQSNVRPALDDSGAENSMYTIPAGGRRFRALELLVSSRRMNKTALLP